MDALAGADLRGYTFERLDLRGASLRGARLEGASFAFVEAYGADFGDARCGGASFRHCDLTLATFTRTECTDTRWHACTADRADFSGASLVNAALQHSVFDDAMFRGALLKAASSEGSTFRRADFTDAVGFTRCREVLVELFRRGADGSLDEAKLVGLLAAYPALCYAEWKALLGDPQLRRRALEVMAAYPRSGFAEALEAAEAQPDRLLARLRD